MIIACFDVYYYTDCAKACAIVFKLTSFEKVINNYSVIIKKPNRYISGAFYKRELPCLLEVMKVIHESIDIAVIDGYVFLDEKKPGLGAYFFNELQGKIPVIGVAKTYYKNASNFIKVYRGISVQPLFISSIGINLEKAALLIKNLEGKNRIPDIIKKVDSLTKKKE